MRFIAVFILLLLLALPAVPVLALGDEPEPTGEIIGGVTPEPVPDPTEPFVTPEPGTPDPTPVRTVTEPVPPPVPVTTEIPGPQVGWLTIISTPSGARVSIDGQAAGSTPITGRELGAGAHSIRLALAGYEPYQTEKMLGAGEQAAVDAVLAEIPVPVPTTPPVTRPVPIPTTRETGVPVTEGPGPCLGCDKGWIRVNANADGADVSFDGSPACTISGGSCDTEVVTTTLPFRSFTVRKTGYQIFNGRVSGWPAKGETVNLYATLDPVPPAPSYGSIRVVSSPPGAVVTLDGGNWQYTPATFSSVTAGGNHFLQITMSGYQPYGTSAYVAAGETATVNAYLVRTTPYPATGSLRIETTPAGADIYVDGTYISESPYTVSSLSPGSHLLRLHRSGYDEYMATVTVIEGRQTPVIVRFNPQLATVGSIEVASTPAGSALYLDGNYMGQTQPGSYADLTSVLEGTHTVLIRQQDFQDYSQTVFVRGGQVVTINARLSSLPPGPVQDTTGQIIIVSTPAGADLFLDNTFRGITPVTLADIPAGSHTVTVKQAGWTDASQVVTVTGGQSTPVALGLMEMPKTTMTPLSLIPVAGCLAVLAFFARRERT